jgi:hypothetical protein
MTAQADLDIAAFGEGLRRHLRAAIGAALVVGVVTAGLVAFWPARYHGAMVVVPVQGARGLGSLSGAASLLGANVELGSGGFNATRDVVAYLLTSRTVLLRAAVAPYAGAPVAVPIVGIDPGQAEPDRLVARLRRALRVSSSRETGFVTAAVRARDSGAVRAFLSAVIAESQGVFTAVAQAQARQLRLAQGMRADSARVALGHAEEELAEFDLRNRVVPSRSLLALQRARLERALGDAGRAWEQVTADLQAAEARELERAPALAVVEDLPAELAPMARQPVSRGLLAGLAAGLLWLLAMGTAELLKAAGVRRAA